MRFHVGQAAVSDTSYNPQTGGALRGPASTVAPGLAKIVRLPGTRGGTPLAKRIPDGTAVQAYRQLTLNPMFGSGHCHWPGIGEKDTISELLLNNTKWNGLRAHTTTPIPGATKVNDVWETELPQIGSTEVWDLIDLSNDNHRSTCTWCNFRSSGIPFDMQAFGAAYYRAFPQHRMSVSPAMGRRVLQRAQRRGRARRQSRRHALLPGEAATVCQDDGIYDGMTGPTQGESGWKDTVIASCGHVTAWCASRTCKTCPPLPTDARSTIPDRTCSHSIRWIRSFAHRQGRIPRRSRLRLALSPHRSRGQ